MKKSVLTFLLIAPFVIFGQTFNEIIKAVAEDREIQDRFGYSVDISGDYAIVGAYADDFSDLDPNMGSAYIFEKEGVGDWTFVQKIFNSDQDDYDRFGWSVAIDGDYAVVGAYAEDHDVFDATMLASAGSAYIFERDISGLWVQVQKIVPSDREAGDEFGWSVAISDSTIIVGAHFESHDEAGLNYIYHTGSVYVFDRDDAGVWNESQKIVGSGRAADITFPDGGGGEDLSDQFGGAVSISGDRLIVGAHHHDYNADDIDPLSEAGAAYIFERTAGVWNEVAKLQNSDRATVDRFGFDVGIDGNYAIITAYSEDENEVGGITMANSGSAYLFTRDISGVWTETQKIVANDRSPGDRFGWAVDIENTTIVIGSIECNTDQFGADILTDAGAAYTYEFDIDSDTWVFLNKIDASDRQANDKFGGAVGLSGEGIIIGAFQQDFDLIGGEAMTDAGAVYFYTREVCEPSASSQTLTLCAGQTVIVGPFIHNETGVYTDILFSESGCDSTVTTDLTILPAPSSSQSAEICFGYSFDVGGVSHTETGEYTDTITGVDGCDSLIHTSLLVSPENAVTQNITICWGDSYTIGASTYTSAGIYEDVLTSWVLCDCTITTILEVQLPVNKSISQSLNLLTADSDDATYQWIKCAPYEIIPGATEQSYWAPAFGQYAVIVTEGACTDTSACVYVDVLSTPEFEQYPLITVYPNPSNGQFWISGLTEELYGSEWVISDLLGETIQTFQIQESPFSVSLNNLAPGIYVLTGINLAGGPQSFQLILR